MRHDHSATAVSLTANFVEGFAIRHLLSEVVDVGFPEIGYDLEYVSTSNASSAVSEGRGFGTLPQEKQRIGMIMVSLAGNVLELRVCC